MFMCLLFQITSFVMSSCERMFYLSLTDHLSINNFNQKRDFYFGDHSFKYLSNRIKWDKK